MIQASRKNTDPNMAQKWPQDAMQNPMAETINKIQPMKLMVWFVMSPHARIYGTLGAR